jgi:hypothetical protein
MQGLGTFYEGLHHIVVGQPSFFHCHLMHPSRAVDSVVALICLPGCLRILAAFPCTLIAHGAHLGLSHTRLRSAGSASTLTSR